MNQRFSCAYKELAKQGKPSRNVELNFEHSGGGVGLVKLDLINVASFSRPWGPFRGAWRPFLFLKSFGCCQLYVLIGAWHPVDLDQMRHEMDDDLSPEVRY